MALIEDFASYDISEYVHFDTVSREYTFRSMNRQQFHVIFRFLADAIDPKHLKNCPIIFIDGGQDTWKSLVADIMMRCFDDFALFEGIKNQDFEPLNRFSGESRECEASRNPFKLKTLCAGVASEFFFRSAFGYNGYRHNLESTVLELNPDGDKNGIMFCSGTTEEHESKILDICIKYNKDMDAHDITIIPANDVLQDCVRFNAYMNVLSLAKNASQLLSPDPSIWKESINPEIPN